MKGQARLFAALLVACFLASAARVNAQPAVDEHAGHHPGGAPPAAAASEGLKPTPPSGAALPTAPQPGCAPGAMSCMGGGVRPFYSRILDMPALTPESRAAIAAEAERRIGWGAQGIAASHARLEGALATHDIAGARLATDALHEAMQNVESGTSALQAIASGTAPREIALAWFRTEMNLAATDAPASGQAGPWGLSWFHTLVMASAATLLLALFALQVTRMRRVRALAAAVQGAPPRPLASLPVAAPPEVPAPLPVQENREKQPRDRTQRWRGRLRVTAIFPETHDVKTFRLMCEDGKELPFTFTPGQFLTVTVELHDGKRSSRSYTIASAPTRTCHVEITVKREEQGEVSRHLHDRVAIGDLLDVVAPVGAFTFSGDESKDVVLIAGGVGITPMMSIIRTLTDRSWPGEIHLVYGARSTQDFIFRDEIEYLQRRHANLHVAATMRRAEGTSWMGPEGVVSKEFIARSVPEIARRRIHLCGPPPMMEAVKVALSELGVPAENIRTEAFGPARGQVPPTVAGKAANAPATAAATAATGPADTGNAGPAPGKTGGAGAQLTFAKSAKSVVLEGGKTVLEAAEETGVAIDFACRVGTCGICAVKLLSGTVVMAVEEGLPPEDKARGMILACQAKSTSDIVVEA